MKKTLSLIIVFISIVFNLYAEDTAKVKIKSIIKISRITEEVNIDGVLAEEFYKTAIPITSFIQKEPEEGKPVSEKTEAFIGYNDEAIFVGVNCLDSKPDSIIARLSRRDNIGGSDVFYLALDPYYDKRSGFFFGISAAGTKIDGTISNDSWDDDSWDGVWIGKANINSSGWVCEMKIPFSQMKFKESEKMIWGIILGRDIGRKKEEAYSVYIPKNEGGFVSHFDDLVGLENIKPSSQLEILPYITSRGEYLNHEPKDPFNDGSNYIFGAGADIKYALSTNLTLNATINPDFGQVEVDPAVVNLSDVETFYSEKRPFFIEGSSIFNFGSGGARNYWGFNFWSPDFFYSRRIGRSPQGSLTNYDFVDMPSGTHILGAAKISGKVGNNWNIGSIQSLTKREFAEIELNGIKSNLEIEPLTYYGIFRAQKEFNEGKQGLGFIGTTTARFFNDYRLQEEINKNAYTGGIDGWTFLDSSKTWVIAGWGGYTHVTGTKERILELQRSSLHYFQRPDADYIEVDSNATKLDGYALRLYLNRQKGNFFFNSAIGVISPGFDVNDVGFMGQTNTINSHIGAGYSWTAPTNYYRYVELGGAVFLSSDFGGNKTGNGLFHFGNYQFTNYYSINWNMGLSFDAYNNRTTRGGPIMKSEGEYNYSIYINSDSRKDITAFIGLSGSRSKHSNYYGYFSSLNFRPASNIFISLEPSIDFNSEYAQWVTSRRDLLAVSTYGRRYIFAEMNQKTFVMGMRLNWTFTPDLSLQLYIQPLISSGDYKNYKEFAKPKTYDFVVYGKDGNSTLDETNLTVDPDGNGPAGSFQIDNPDFNFKSLRGNAVLRWEYLPGSIFYFVWTQSRSDFENIGEFRFNKSVNRIFDANPDNIFMIKATFWLNY
jgi:hypothetical protein